MRLRLVNVLRAFGLIPALITLCAGFSVVRASENPETPPGQHEYAALPARTTEAEPRPQNGKDLLEKIWLTNTQEASLLKERLESLERTAVEKEFLSYYERLGETVRGHLAFLAAFRKKIIRLPDAPSREIIERLGNELRAWREENYDPSARETIEFVLAIRIKEAVLRAEQRWLALAAHIEHFSSARTKMRFAKELNAAGADLRSARTSRDAIRELLRQRLTAPYARLDGESAAPLLETTAQSVKTAYGRFMALYRTLAEYGDSK